jgi:hypothetical protein
MGKVLTQVAGAGNGVEAAFARPRSKRRERNVQCSGGVVGYHVSLTH